MYDIDLKDFFSFSCILASSLDLKVKMDVRHYYLAERVKNQFYLLVLQSLIFQYSSSGAVTTVSIKSFIR